MQNHARKAVRERENREIERIRALERSIRREHWHRLKAIGNLGAARQVVPTAAVDSAGVEQTSIEGVRDIWLDTWERMARHGPDDPNFDRAFLEEVEEKVQEREIAAAASMVDGERVPAADGIDNGGVEEQQLNHPIGFDEVCDSIRRLATRSRPAATASSASC